jgi:hypothetical protein
MLRISRPVGSSRVDRLAAKLQNAQRHAFRIQALHDFPQVQGRARQPEQFSDDQRVTLPNVVERRVKLAPLRDG